MLVEEWRKIEHWQVSNISCLEAYEDNTTGTTELHIMIILLACQEGSTCFLFPHKTLHEINTFMATQLQTSVSPFLSLSVFSIYTPGVYKCQVPSPNCKTLLTDQHQINIQITIIDLKMIKN